MAKIYEKRKDSRHKLNVSLICRTSLSGADYHAKKLNHSHTGISFMSSHDLKPGTIVYIRRESCPPHCRAGKACESCRMVALATVKWCRQGETAGKGSYSAGANYFF